MEKTDEKAVSYVRLENANLIRLSMRKISKLFTKYGTLILTIKKLRDNKEDLKKEVVDSMTEIEKEYLGLIEVLPKSSKIKKIKKPKTKRAPDIDVEIRTSLESFAALRKEFEKIKTELEGIS